MSYHIDIFYQNEFGIIDENEESVDSKIKNDDITEEEEKEIVLKCQRRKSSFSLAKLGLHSPYNLNYYQF